ncbi:hypothetical protein [Kribbella sp. DT2]|uniref:hypothetical protein n=1 Tax=Kribbella sp. DT2 TaxID=3393427 RepID=UPI003CEFF5FB
MATDGDTAGESQLDDVELAHLVLAFRRGASQSQRNLAIEYWAHPAVPDSDQLLLTWTHRVADLPVPDDWELPPRRGLGRIITKFCTATSRWQCPGCGTSIAATGRATLGTHLRAFGRHCRDCGTAQLPAPDATPPATTHPRETPDRSLDGLTTDQIIALANLGRPIRGGAMEPSHLDLAEALLLFTLTECADDAGVIGPLRDWSPSVARLQHSPRMLQAWQSLLDQDILSVHSSTPSTAFLWSGAAEPKPLPHDAHWFIARGRAGDEPADTASATYTDLREAFEADSWDLPWITDVEQVATELVVAEGIEYFHYLLAKRGNCPPPTAEAQSALEAAMLDAASDHSLGEIIYLTWKPIAKAVDPYKFVKKIPTAEVADQAVAEFTKRAPRYRANGWTVEQYDLDESLPPAATCTAIFRLLGADPRTTRADQLAVAAEKRADELAQSELVNIAAEEELLAAGSLDGSAWAAILTALDDAGRPGESPQPAEEQFLGLDDMMRRGRRLAAVTADYLREIDKLWPDDRAQHLANCYAGAGLAAHAMLVGEIGSTAAAVHADSDFMASSLQQCLLEAYVRARKDQNNAEAASTYSETHANFAGDAGPEDHLP